MVKRTVFCYLAAAVFITGRVFAQQPALTGAWSGWLTQPNDHFALAREYAFSLTLAEDRDDFNYSHIAIDSLSFFGVMAASADIRDGEVAIWETRIIEQKIEGAYWYLKEYLLTYHPEDDTLRGRWKAGGHYRGDIVLYRVKRFSHEIYANICLRNFEFN